MITVTIRVNLILKAFGYTVTILVGAFILATLLWIVTGNPDLGTWSFWGSMFIGLLAVLTDGLKMREALLTQHARSAVAEYAFRTHQVSTATIVDLNLGLFDLHLTRCTDLERSKLVPTHFHTNQITEITQD